MYHSGKSDEVEKAPLKPEGATVTETLREKLGGFFRKGGAHADYPSSEPYEGPTTTTLRATEVEGEPIHSFVSVYSTGRSDELPAVSIPIEEVKPAEETPIVYEKVHGILKKPVPFYPVSEAYLGEFEDTIRTPEVFGE